MILNGLDLERKSAVLDYLGVVSVDLRSNLLDGFLGDHKVENRILYAC